jgi:thiol-disulfide isomerase/thioredoxin
LPPLFDVDAAAVSNLVQRSTNRVVLLHVWATWCPPCVEEFPQLVRLHRAYADKGLDLILISADSPGERASVRRFLSKHGVDWTTYRGSNMNDAFIRSVSTNWTGAIPASFFYGADGALQQEWEGARSFPEYEETVTGL